MLLYRDSEAPVIFTRQGRRPPCGFNDLPRLRDPPRPVVQPCAALTAPFPSPIIAHRFGDECGQDLAWGL